MLPHVGVRRGGVRDRNRADCGLLALDVVQYTTQLSIDSTPALVLPHKDDANNLVPVQIILVIKAQNQKKINSHRWLFKAIGGFLQVSCHSSVLC